MKPKSMMMLVSGRISVANVATEVRPEKIVTVDVAQCSSFGPSDSFQWPQRCVQKALHHHLK